MTRVEYLSVRKTGTNQDKDWWILVSSANSPAHDPRLFPKAPRDKRGRVIQGAYRPNGLTIRADAHSDGKVHLRFYNQGTNGRQDRSKYVDISLDIPALDERRTLKRGVIVPVDIADAVERDDYQQVAELASRRMSNSG